MESTINKAIRVGREAATYGFDWENPVDAIAKIHEECDELQSAETDAHRLEEFGDLMFAVMNVARKLQIDPDRALGLATEKFETRFAYVCAKIKSHPDVPTLETMEGWWQEAKQIDL